MTAGILYFVLLLFLGGCSELSPVETGDAERGASESDTPVIAKTDYSNTGLRISEAMSKNRAALPDANGLFPDWVEVENTGTQSLSLSGWTISDGKKAHRQLLPDVVLTPGEFVVVFCEKFGIADGEILFLEDPDGKKRDELLCSASTADCSVSRLADGSTVESQWISPGYQNGKAGYDLWCSSRITPSEAVIYEVAVSNSDTSDYSKRPDWVEIKNNSSVPLDLNNYFLSDDDAIPDMWRFPSRTLQPGEIIVFSCDGELPASEENTGFSLDGFSDQLYLYDASGKLVDYTSLHDIPTDGSLGRIDGECGFFYFSASSKGKFNFSGVRRVSDIPICLTTEGPYNDIRQLEVELSGSGTVCYTLDGSTPSEVSTRYSGPITLSKTGVVRAVSVEPGALPSRTATFSFFLNEGHVFPILSLVTGESATFEQMYTFGMKAPSVSAHLALFEDGETKFSRECELTIKGWTSLTLPKKSMGVEFKGRYGGNLDCDVFGNGITEYHSLSLRAGQDYTFSFFRNELFQELCLEASDSLYTQESKYCVLYINGSYYGVYCLKEDFSDQYYASHAGVSVESVEGFRAPAPYLSEYNRLVQEWGQTADMTIAENYQKVCDQINIDSLIDWFLFESWCANTDTQGNQRVYRSTENGNRWEYAFYDLDWGLWYHEGNFKILLVGIGNVGAEMPWFLTSLLKNPDFRDRVLTRYAELVNTVFDDEYVLSKIDSYVTLLAPELPRDRDRWNLTMQSWEDWVDSLREIIRNGYTEYTVDTLCECLEVSAEERKHYFG